MKTEGVGNKVMLIALLCAALALFLYIRPRLFAPDPPPSLLDRLPESEIVGRYNLLDIAKIESAEQKALAYCDEVKTHFDEIRYHADKLELLVDDESWTLTKYRELLFTK